VRLIITLLLNIGYDVIISIKLLNILKFPLVSRLLTAKEGFW